MKSIAKQLQESNPELFMNNNNNNLNQTAKNLIQLTGYNDNNECELLAVNVENINNNNNIDLTKLIEYNQCGFDNEIISNDQISNTVSHSGDDTSNIPTPNKAIINIKNINKPTLPLRNKSPRNSTWNIEYFTLVYLRFIFEILDFELIKNIQKLYQLKCNDIFFILILWRW